MTETVQLQEPDVPSQDERREAVRTKILAGSGDKAVDAQWQLALRAEQGEAIEGSPAIAYGRAIALAVEKQRMDVARYFWEQLPFEHKQFMQTVGQLYSAYSASPEKFTAFAPGQNGFADGTAFSNAVGSYAYATDVAQRGTAALYGGEAEQASQWGAKALQAAGIGAQTAAADAAVPLPESLLISSAPTPPATVPAAPQPKPENHGNLLLRGVSAAAATAIGAWLGFKIGKLGDNIDRKQAQQWFSFFGGFCGALISLYATRPNVKRDEDNSYMQRFNAAHDAAPPSQTTVAGGTVRHEGKMQAAVAQELSL